MSSNSQRFADITLEMLELYELKNRNYGDSFSKSFNEFGLTMACIRLQDKLERLKSLNRQGSEADCDDESIIDTLTDLGVYSILTIMEVRNEKQNT